jgi:hypothetical protein
MGVRVPPPVPIEQKALKFRAFFRLNMLGKIAADYSQQLIQSTTISFKKKAK